MALQSRALVKTWGHSEKGRLVVTMTAAFTALSVFRPISQLALVTDQT
jgi:hypothetical protein